MNNNEIIENNKTYWNEHADLWFGTTALPVYGVRFPTEDDLHLFGDVTDKKMLEICCGSGHSLKYNAEKGAGELWGVDLSQKQLDNASKLLHENGYSAKLMCANMEDELEVPKDYFDYVYSIINALAKAGFLVEQMIEESDEKSLNARGDLDPKTRKAQMMPISFCIKATMI